MCETVPRVVAAPRPRPRARLLRGAPPPRASYPPCARSRPPARRPPRASFPSLLVADGNGNQKEIQATRGGRRRARWWQRTWPRRGGATRAGRRRGAQPHTECAPPIGHRPARTVVHLDVWALQNVDSQSESPEQETRRMPIQLSPERARLRINNSRIFYFSARLSRI